MKFVKSKGFDHPSTSQWREYYGNVALILRKTVMETTVEGRK